jgi:hypothetical protein
VLSIGGAGGDESLLKTPREVTINKGIITMLTRLRKIIMFRRVFFGDKLMLFLGWTP